MKEGSGSRGHKTAGDLGFPWAGLGSARGRWADARSLGQAQGPELPREGLRLVPVLSKNMETHKGSLRRKSAGWGPWSSACLQPPPRPPSPSPGPMGAGISRGEPFGSWTPTLGSRQALWLLRWLFQSFQEEDVRNQPL